MNPEFSEQGNVVAFTAGKTDNRQNSQQTTRFVVLTGGPGSGKSTLIDALQNAGYARSMEAGRGVIQDQIAIGGQALPWGDQMAFAELMLSWEMRSYHIAKHASGLVFFDRGVPDIVGYLRLVNKPVPPHIEKAAQVFRYNQQVFITPPWKEIFCRDHERKQDFEEAVRTYEMMAATYSDYGYGLIQIPRAPVQARIDFILSNSETSR